jgi:23S rRNA A2030 N6-methylase RlmJ
VLQHLNQKDKGYRVVDTHAGAGAYALGSRHAQLHREYAGGIGRLWGRDDLPPAVPTTSTRCAPSTARARCASTRGHPSWRGS